MKELVKLIESGKIQPQPVIMYPTTKTVEILQKIAEEGKL